MPPKDHSFSNERYAAGNFMQADGHDSIEVSNPDFVFHDAPVFVPHLAWYHPYGPYYYPDDYDSYYPSQYFPSQHPAPPRQPARPRRPERPRHPERPRRPEPPRQRRRPRPEPPGRPRVYGPPEERYGPPDPYGRRPLLPPVPEPLNVTGTYDITMPGYTGEMALRQRRYDPYVSGYYIYRGTRGQGTFSGNLEGRMFEGNVMRGTYRNADGRTGGFELGFTPGPPERYTKFIQGNFVEGELTGASR